MELKNLVLSLGLWSLSAMAAQPASICNRNPNMRDALLWEIQNAHNDAWPDQGHDVAQPDGTVIYYPPNPPAPTVTCDQVTTQDLQQVHQAFEFNSVANLPFAPSDFAGLPGVTEMTIYDTNQAANWHLVSGYFDGIPNLEQLTLESGNAPSSSTLLTVDAGSMDALSHLSQLYFGADSVNVDGKAFRNQAALRRLGLGNLRSVPEGLFDGLTSLEELDVNSIGGGTWPRDIFAKLTNLRKLSFFGAIPAKEIVLMLAGLDKLEEVAPQGWAQNSSDYIVLNRDWTQTGSVSNYDSCDDAKKAARIAYLANVKRAIEGCGLVGGKYQVGAVAENCRERGRQDNDDFSATVGAPFTCTR